MQLIKPNPLKSFVLMRLRNGLKIRVSLVRFRPWAPLKIKDLGRLKLTFGLNGKRIRENVFAFVPSHSPRREAHGVHAAPPSPTGRRRPGLAIAPCKKAFSSVNALIFAWMLFSRRPERAMRRRGEHLRGTVASWAFHCVT
jgi:hypothetical protein